VVCCDNRTRLGLGQLGLREGQEPDLVAWSGFANALDDEELEAVTIAVVGKYTANTESYHSLVKVRAKVGERHRSHARDGYRAVLAF
jgi:CTP synthase (UTP-ammonia lyase)